MYFDDRRMDFLHSRLQGRLKECRVDSFYSYYRLLISPNGKHELSRLLEDLTINETSFFRSKPQLDLFHKYLLDDIFRKKHERGDYSLRIWSAGCSTGQEPYTLAMLVADGLAYYCLRKPSVFSGSLPRPLVPAPWRVEILASDINYSVLRAGQEGIYSEHHMATVDYSYRLRYFDKVGERYAVKKSVKELVHFDFHNLKTQYLPQGNDAIFCRNVMMYFDQAEQKRLVEKFRRCLNPGGLPAPGPCREPARTERQICHGSSQRRDRLPAHRGARVSQFSDERGAELRELFFETSQEILQALNEEALKLEKNPGDVETVRNIRRTVHTLKGDAAACGFRELSELAHELEDALALEHTASPGFAGGSGVYRGGRFRGHAGLLSRQASPCPRGAAAQDGSRLGAGSEEPRRRSAQEEGNSEARRHGAKPERLAIQNALRQGKRVYQITIHLDPLCAMPIAARQLALNALSGMGQVLASRARNRVCLSPPSSCSSCWPRSNRTEQIAANATSPP